MDLGHVATTVVAVLADEALDAEAESDPGVGSWAPSPGISCRGCAPPDDVSEDDDDEGGGEGSRGPRALEEDKERLGCACFALAASSQSRRYCAWLCVLTEDVEPCLGGLVVGRGVWWGWEARSRDRLMGRLW